MAEIKIKADSNGGTVSLKGPATTTGDAAIQLTLPVDDGTANQYLKTDGSGVLSWATVAGGISNVVEDTTPQLGGDLDVNGNQIKGDDVQIHAADDQVIAKFHKTNSSEFHFNGSKKLEVNNTGIGVTGSVTPSGGIYLGGSGGSNYLSDYEEGTWTPADGGGIVSFNEAYGQYRKIGKLVIVAMFLRCNNNVTDGGNAHIVGLPFQSSNTNGAGHGSCSIGASNQSDNFNGGHMTKNSTSFYFYSGSYGHMTRAQMWDGDSTNKRLICTLTYFVD